MRGERGNTRCPFFFGLGQISAVVQFGTGQLNISGTASVSLGIVCLGAAVPSTFVQTITGSGATVSAAMWGIDNGATAKWVFDATGISPIAVSSDIKLDALLGGGWWEQGGGTTRDGGNLVIDLASYTGPGGTFTLLNGPTGSLSVGEEFKTVTFLSPGTYGPSVAYGSGAGGSGDVTVTLVPEPATMALLAIGGLGMLIRRRRA